MRTRELVLLVFTLVIGCRGRVPLELPPHTTGLRTGMSVEELREIYPGARFLPYAGWIDSTRSDPLFAQIVFTMSRSSPGPERARRERLRMVELLGRSAEVNVAVRGELRSRFGDSEAAGCAPRIDAGDYQVLVWPSPEIRVVGVVGRDSTGREVGAISVTLAPRDAPLQAVVGLPDALKPCERPTRGPR